MQQFLKVDSGSQMGLELPPKIGGSGGVGVVLSLLTKMKNRQKMTSSEVKAN